MYTNSFALCSLIALTICLTDVSCQRQKCLGTSGDYCPGSYKMSAVCRDGYCVCFSQDYDYETCLRKYICLRERKTLKDDIYICFVFNDPILICFALFSAMFFWHQIVKWKIIGHRKASFTLWIKVNSAYAASGPSGRSLSGFCSMKWLEVFLFPLDGMLIHRRVIPSSKFAGTHLYTWVASGTVRVKCLAQEHSAVPPPWLKPGPLDSESSTLSIWPPKPYLNQ